MSSPWYPGRLQGRASRLESIGRTVNAAVAHDRGDELGGSDVERGVVDGYIVRHNRASGDAGHFVAAALLDRDRGAVCDRHIERGGRRRDIKRNPVVPRRER